MKYLSTIVTSLFFVVLCVCLISCYSNQPNNSSSKKELSNENGQNEKDLACKQSVKVTENSVGTFYIGQNINDIPPSGDFYDRFEKSDYGEYEVFCGDNKIISLFTKNSSKIVVIHIFASYIELNNGIHTGMTGEELEKNYNAKIILENEVTLTWTRFEIPGFGRHMFYGDVPANSIIDYDDWGKPIKAEYLPGCKLEYIQIY